MNEESTVFHVSDDGPVRVLTLDRPATKNAIPRHGWHQLASAFGDFERSVARVLVVTGAGGEFCSGADLDPAMLDDLTSPAVTSRFMKGPGAAALALHRLSKPTIAMVDGVAAGAGMNLAIGCDVVIASDRARFAEIFVRRGLTLDFGGTWLLPRLVGLARARELALTGRIVNADEALEIGLVSKVVPATQLEAVVRETAASLAAGAPLAQSVIKRAMDRSSELSFEQAIAFEDQAQAVLLASGDFKEAVAAFQEKRAARFRGR